MSRTFNEATRVQMPAMVHLCRLGYQFYGKHAPEQYRFNDAFPSTNKQGVKKAKEKIKQVLEI